MSDKETPRAGMSFPVTPASDVDVISVDVEHMEPTWENVPLCGLL